VLLAPPDAAQLGRHHGHDPDGSPIIDRTPVEGLFFNGGWCYGGFKATPGSGFVFAHTIAQDRPHPQNAALTLERFAEGRAIDERGGGPFPWVH